MYHLTVQNGAAKGATWKIEEGVILLGRSQECTIRIPNDTAVSRVHCELHVDGASVAVTQISDRSVTLLNGKVVQRADMKAGDTLTLGLTTLLLGRSADGDAAMAAPRMALVTRTVSEADAVFLGGRKSERALSARVESLRDLAELFRLSNEFNQAETPVCLLELLGAAVRERFEPAWACLARAVGLERNLEILPLPGFPDGPGGEAVHGALRRASESGEGALIPRAAASGAKGGACTILVGPLNAGGQTIGALAVENAPGNAVYDENALQFFVALCRAIAPCMNSVARIVELKQEVARLRSAIPDVVELLGNSPAMERARFLLKQAAQSQLNILILGESGTGKELAARMTHDYAAFRDGPYVVVNCAAIPAEMLESELFGYTAGAFTGASDSRQGLIARADGGTLFLDEVGDLSLPNQARVLRVLETGAYRQLGSDAERRSSFRTVSATNKDIPAMVASGEFRNDLFHRLNGFEIVLPPLRDHPEDIPALAEHFYRREMLHAKRPLKGIHPGALARLSGESWPGNARQLRNVIERGIVVAQGEYIAEDDLALAAPAQARAGAEGELTLLEAEKRHLAIVIRQCNGDAGEAARKLGLSRSTFYHKVKKFGIDLTPGGHAD